MPCTDHLKCTCANPSCEKWHSPVCLLFYKSVEGCKFGDKCAIEHCQVEEQLSKRCKRSDDKSAVALLKETKNFGCRFQDVEFPKTSSFLRKSSTTTKPIRCVRFTTAVLRNAKLRDQNPSVNKIGHRDSHQRSPNAPKFEDRSQETVWQEHWACEAAWKLARKILKEKHKAAFFSPTEKWCLSSPSKGKPEEREFVVSGASMHMIRREDLNSAELETLTIFRCPTTVITANGEVETHEEATVYVREVENFLSVKNPRAYASSVIARKALRGSRISIWEGRWSKTTSHSKWRSNSTQHGEPRSDRGPGSVYGFLFIELISNSNIITAGKYRFNTYSNIS